MRVLLAEDDEYLSAALQLALTRKDYVVDSVRSGVEAQVALRTADYDIVLLDLGLPEVEGTQILSELRSRGDELPVIVITARDQVEDRIKGLDLGANDYLVKPFDFGELEARMRAALRKTHWLNKLEISFGSLRLDTNSGTLFLGNHQMELTPRESTMLKALMAKRGRVISKRQLMEEVSDWTEEASENAVEIVIHRLRKKLESADVAIDTVRGFGYVLKEKS